MIAFSKSGRVIKMTRKIASAETEDSSLPVGDMIYSLRAIE